MVNEPVKEERPPEELCTHRSVCTRAPFGMNGLLDVVTLPEPVAAYSSPGHGEVPCENVSFAWVDVLVVDSGVTAHANVTSHPTDFSSPTKVAEPPVELTGLHPLSVPPMSPS